MLFRHHLPTQVRGKPSVVTWGNFDGMHLGHQFILKSMKKLAIKKRSQMVVILFYPPPKVFFSRDASTQLMSIGNKYLLLKSLGVDYVLCLRFNRALVSMSADDFVHHYAVKELNCCDLFLGEDARFGADRMGSAKKLMKEHWPFDIHVIRDQLVENERVSSTKVRQLMKEGNLAACRNLLGLSAFLSVRVLAVTIKGEWVARIKGQMPSLEGRAVEVVWDGGGITSKIIRQSSLVGSIGYQVYLSPIDTNVDLPARIRVYW
ncbi:MAG TPA: FAD synthetase family protein [Gammaproteobacteria bacterium]|nr:FAD synthetase family protein [Gammaproteobacteria bacterium]